MEKLTVRQCAEESGLRESTWRAWILLQKVSYLKLGRAVRIERAELDRILAAARVDRKAK